MIDNGPLDTQLIIVAFLRPVGVWCGTVCCSVHAQERRIRAVRVCNPKRVDAARLPALAVLRVQDVAVVQREVARCAERKVVPGMSQGDRRRCVEPPVIVRAGKRLAGIHRQRSGIRNVEGIRLLVIVVAHRARHGQLVRVRHGDRSIDKR